MTHPLIAMLNRAGGLLSDDQLEMVILCCPEQRIPRHASDLPGTAVIESYCPACYVSDDTDVHYFAADGSHIKEVCRG